MEKIPVLYTVGKKLPLDIATLKNVDMGGYFDVDSTSGVYIMAIASPTTEEIESFRNKPAKIGLVLNSPVAFILADVGAFMIDAPYSPHLGTGCLLEEFSEGLGLPLNCILVDSKTSIIKALRILGLSQKLSNKLVKFCQSAKDDAFDHAAYKNKIQSIYQHYSPKNIWDIAVETCEFS